MERNVCGLDRLVRLTVGPALLTLAYVRSHGRRTDPRRGSVSIRDLAMAYAGAELLINGLVQWCPGNALLGFDTCE